MEIGHTMEQKQDMAFDLNKAMEGLSESDRKALVGKRIETSDGVFEFREVNTLSVGNEAVKKMDLVRLADDNTVYLGKNNNIRNDYSDEAFLNSMYDDYLSAVQNFDALLRIKKGGGNIGKLYDVNSTFEQYLRDALVWNKQQREKELPMQLSTGRIDQRTYQNAKSLLEMNYDTMKRFINGEIKF